MTPDSSAAARPPADPWYARPAIVGILVFLALLVVKFDTLTEPPAWDAAMSVHPAAITLAETGFDYPALLALPGYADGGPNTHSLSVYTTLVAIAYAVFNPPTAILVLHLVSFVFGAFAGIALVRLGRHFVPPSAAALIAVLSIAFPLVLTQFGMLYLEAPVLTATLWALVAAVEQRWVATAAFSLLATSVKPSGAITAAALAVLYVTQKKSWGKSIAIVVPSAVVFGFQMGAAGGIVHPSVQMGSFIARASWPYLLFVPDLLGLLLVATLAAWAGAIHSSTKRTSGLGHVWSSFALSYVMFYAVLMSVGFLLLPRYYVQVVPLAMATTLVYVFDRYGSRVFYVTATLALLWFMLNFNGAVYPRQSINNLASIERSDAYDQLLALEILASAAICELSVEAPVWYSKPEAYRLQYPRMGYADCSPGGQAIQRDTDDLDLGDLPEKLFVAFEHPWLGGGALYRLVAEAKTSPDWTVEVVRTVAVGNFRQVIYRLVMVGSS